MNKQRRDLLKTALNFVEQALSVVTQAKDQEQNCLDNMPENMIDSDRYAKMESAVDQLEEAENGLEEVKQAITEAIA